MEGFLFTQWMWLLAALVLLILEVLVPGTFFVWLGLAAAAVGFSVWALVLPVPVQLALFAAYSLVTIFVGRRIQYRRSDAPETLNQGPERLIGEVVTVSDNFVNGRGRVRVGDTTWRAKGPDLSEGMAARITGHDGGILLVEPK